MLHNHIYANVFIFLDMTDWLFEEKHTKQVNPNNPRMVKGQGTVDHRITKILLSIWMLVYAIPSTSSSVSVD